MIDAGKCGLECRLISLRGGRWRVVCGVPAALARDVDSLCAGSPGPARAMPEGAAGRRPVSRPLKIILAKRP